MGSASVREEFDTIAGLGDELGFRTDRFDDFLLSLVPSSARSVLDVGCGGGALTGRLAARAREVIGLDLSPAMIARARRREHRSDVTFRCGDFMEEDFAGRLFDCVISISMLHHVPLDAGLQRMRELVAPGGRLVVHDLRSDDGVADVVRSYAALGCNALLRLATTGRLFPPKRVRDAWARHSAGETYPTFVAASALAARLLPGARLFYHWLWRYTIVWTRPENRDTHRLQKLPRRVCNFEKR